MDLTAQGTMALTPKHRRDPQLAAETAAEIAAKWLLPPCPELAWTNALRVQNAKLRGDYASW